MAESREHGRGFSRRPRILDLVGAGGTTEAEARDFAHDLVRRARAESAGRIPEGPAPDPDAVRERREIHRHGHDA